VKEYPGIDTTVLPTGTGCVECEQQHGWWFHLRRCTQCGHIGCCDSSPSQHATAHAEASGHRWITSFEPGENWFYNYDDQQVYDDGPGLAPPDHHPLDQPTPGPAGRVPGDWQQRLH
jgi:Zn-finger in ubiquitin-hydrolases and other protein